MNLTVATRMSGPLLTSSDPQPLVKGPTEAEVRELAEVGARLVQAQLSPGHGVLTGEYRNSIHAEITAARNGAIVDGSAIIGSWLEGVSSRNQTTRFKGYHMFRITKEAMEEMARQRLPALGVSIARKLSD